MKKLLFLFAAIMISGIFGSRAQQRPAATPAQPIPLRQVSGIVKDSTDEAVIGAIVTLTSRADTLKASTNADGIYVFKAVKSWEFTVSVTSMGYRTKAVKGKYNDATPRLTMDPIILRNEAKLLNEIAINGTPSITYKTDTVEYRASDYVVRAGATVDELLKKMEGMEVGNDGSVTYNGQSIGKARLNGKDIYGGDVASVIQNLPAEIIEKAQVVDDYGDVAKRTGVKEGDPSKVLNLTTRVDKSVGNQLRLNGGAGTVDQLEGSVNLTRINGNQTITLNGNYFKTPNGIAGGGGGVGRLGGAQNRGGRTGNTFGSPGGNASGGTNTRLNPAFTFRDSFGKKVEFNANYFFNYNSNDAVTETYSEMASTFGATYSTRKAITNNDSRSHNINFEVEYNIDSANFMQFRPYITLNSSDNTGFTTNSQTGRMLQDQVNNNNNNSSTPNVGATVAYQHVWRSKPSRSFSIEATASSQKNEGTTYQRVDFDYKGLRPDSTYNYRTTTDNHQNSYRTSLTFAEPLTKLARLEFNSNVERRSYDNARLTGDLIKGTNRVDSLSNIYEYSFTQYRNSLNYRYGNNAGTYNFSLGLTAVNTSLVGTKASLGTSTDQKYFKIIPIARFQLKFSRSHQLSVNYNGRASEPSFDQIQPVRDVSNPNSVIVGNPDLKVAFTHTIFGQYSNYIANSKLNLSLNANSSFIEDQVTTNVVEKITSPGVFRNEVRYINLGGSYQHNADYLIAKQLNDRRISLSFSGSVNNNNRTSQTDSKTQTATTWGFKENFGPRLNPTTWLEINPYVSYDFNKTNYTLPTLRDIKTNTTALSLDGNVYFLKTWQFGYALSKNFIHSTTNNVAGNPFVINASLQTRVLKNRGTLQLRAFDILNENNFINVTSNGNGFTETKTNPNSRYFMVNLGVYLQKWTGAQGRGGQQIRRRGDGSFVN
ncbi:TonB-dependent receptor [Hufsiella ginkgonis]|uniref:Outer membrane beta-barrel protein n=1 Tax=Hufsiella ginkgonis TaxID=2695274 RepID=A0A7K1XWP4_9SPHI|nr:TonB-dependent receptor [Hufsiella ginkgonis]MXV14936.1 outer membrane beta-barrel protein [Hufsiella ginkgonis]